ncbi:ABC transporter substrate-binding protein, partial [candidate division KSB1 bacterium]
YAVEEYSRYGDTNIRLKAMDTGANPTTIPALFKQISADPSVVAVVGPVTPDAQIIAASLASTYKLPLIFPINYDEFEVTDTEYIFNLMSNAEIEGETIARYAVEELGLMNFGILSPIGSKEGNMANAFALEVENLGGNVLVHEWYFPGTIDFKNQFTNIRKIGYDLQMTDSLRIYLQQSTMDTSLVDSMPGLIDRYDSLMIEPVDTSFSVSEDTLYFLGPGEYDIAILDSSLIDTMQQDALDSLNVAQLDSLWKLYQDTLDMRRKRAGIRRFDSLDNPVFTYDAIFIPITVPEDIDFIANQFAFYNFDAVLLGNNIWYDLEMLERVERNFRNLYFTSDYFLDDFYDPWGKFRDNFRSSVGGSPGIYEIYGYDAMQLVFKAATSFMITKESFRESLNKVNEISVSPRGVIEFSEEHWKKNWMILRYYRSRLRLVETEKDK